MELERKSTLLVTAYRNRKLWRYEDDIDQEDGQRKRFLRNGHEGVLEVIECILQQLNTRMYILYLSDLLRPPPALASTKP